MKKITKIVGMVGAKMRDRSRSVKFHLLEIGRIARAKGAINQEKLKQHYPIAAYNITFRLIGIYIVNARTSIMEGRPAKAAGFNLLTGETTDPAAVPDRRSPVRD
jgi:hypothetical protein